MNLCYLISHGRTDERHKRGYWHKMFPYWPHYRLLPEHVDRDQQSVDWWLDWNLAGLFPEVVSIDRHWLAVRYRWNQIYVQWNRYSRDPYETAVSVTKSIVSIDICWFFGANNLLRSLITVFARSTQECYFCSKINSIDRYWSANRHCYHVLKPVRHNIHEALHERLYMSRKMWTSATGH